MGASDRYNHAEDGLWVLRTASKTYEMLTEDE